MAIIIKWSNGRCTRVEAPNAPALARLVSKANAWAKQIDSLSQITIDTATVTRERRGLVL